jgi:iron complex transport system permease protein
LLFADIIGRLLVPGELRVSVVSAFIGAPVLIILVRRARRWPVTAPSRRLIISCLLMLLASLAFALWGLRSGAVMLDSSQVINALTGSAPRAMQLVVIEWRLPRVLMALLIGAALGVSGAIFQSLMRNPLGSPDVMGFNTGAWSGVLVAMVFLVSI